MLLIPFSWKMLYAARYGKYRQMLKKSDQSIHTLPAIPHLAKQLLDAPLIEDQAENNHYSLRQLYQQLQKIKDPPLDITPSTPTREITL